MNNKLVMESTIEPKYAISKYKSINGVTCYMNSILAILQQTPVFVDYIVTGMFKQSLLYNLNHENDVIKNSISYQLYRVLRTSMENDNSCITPTSLRRALSKKDSIWGEHQHQDSQEFLNFLISKLEEEVSSQVIFIPGGFTKEYDMTTSNSLINILANNEWVKFVKNEYSPIKTLFTGLNQTSLKCKYCNNISNSFEISQLLTLSIPIKNKAVDLQKQFTLEDCLDQYSEEEILDKNNKVMCDFCMRKNQSSKKNSLWRTPKILIIQLKRFLINQYGIPTQKLFNMIDYPIENLDMSKYINQSSPFKEKYKYNLFAVNCHHSFGTFNTINFGHYTSSIKSRYDNKWYKFDDSQPIMELVNRNSIVNKDAYLLFYYRTN